MKEECTPGRETDEGYVTGQTPATCNEAQGAKPEQKENGKRGKSKTNTAVRPCVWRECRTRLLIPIEH